MAKQEKFATTAAGRILESGFSVETQPFALSQSGVVHTITITPEAAQLLCQILIHDAPRTREAIVLAEKLANELYDFQSNPIPFLNR